MLGLGPGSQDRLAYRIRLSALVALTALLGACGSGEPQLEAIAPPPVDGEPSYLDDPIGPLPETIEELGLHGNPVDLRRTHPRALAYEPAFPLWSNGSAKERFLVLPPDQTIDPTNPSSWSFPTGTLFLKTFSYPDAGESGGSRPVETRVLQSSDSGWEYAVYLWDEAGKTAALRDISRSAAVPVEHDGESFEHVVPSKLDCRKCHESEPNTVLGFREIQLGPSGAPESELTRLAARGVFGSEPRPEFERIEHEDPLTEDVLRYFQGNCVHCHNGGEGASSAFDMRHEVALENLIGRKTEGELLSDGVRVVPGDPDASVVFLTLARRSRYFRDFADAARGRGARRRRSARARAELDSRTRAPRGSR